MFIGFDYGTANCSVAIMRDGHPQLLTMENNSALLPSMLCAPTREAVSEWLYRHHDVPATDEETQALLRRAIRYNREEDIEVGAQSVQFGLASLAHYIDDPQEVWFVKSPKSFLGASGLKPQQVALFEDLVCAMMVHIRHTAHSQLPEAITQAVIGRPINFQGLGGDDANRQAQGILERAAKRAGFQEVVFQYEPVAAGLDYEATLREESKIALSGQADVTARLPFISDDLAVAISQQGLEAALDQPLTRILEQVQLALDSAQEKPDVIYLTGGSARSPLIKKALSEQLPGIPVAGGDDFGSVTAGLARWAEVVFR
ncbi:TPA: molecular chaperone [Salmonella enterica subsp. enterica serovar Typhimurium]|nr:molecular chaperone [Salmonella enterica subsp. enterica serovar 1,4,[5],12:i:-]HBJ7321576.1 molecular chaperone [Salmonella enterica subsp. enterica serovar Typhimurium]